ncbi:MAG: SWIM zinc finger family protein [Bacteroidota bacterium]|jgi:hypothetical protein
MKRRIDLRNLQVEKVSKLNVVLRALNVIEERNSPFKERWMQATRKAGHIFTSNDGLLIASMHHQIEKYDSSANSCTCESSQFGKPCYHRAYILLGIRYAEANAD